MLKQKTRAERFLREIVSFLKETMSELRNNLVKAGWGGATIGFLLGIIYKTFLEEQLDTFSFISVVLIAAGIGAVCALPIALGSTILGMFVFFIERIYPPVEKIFFEQFPKALENIIYAILLMFLGGLGQYALLEVIKIFPDFFLFQLLKEQNLLDFLKNDIWVGIVVGLILGFLGSMNPTKSTEDPT